MCLSFAICALLLSCPASYTAAPQKLYPSMALTDNDSYKSVDYGRLTPVLVEAIKDQ